MLLLLCLCKGTNFPLNHIRQFRNNYYICKQDWKNISMERFDIKDVKLHRTTESTLFEIVFAIVMMVVWGLIIWMICRAPDIVPTHFDGSGRPNAYGSPIGILVPCIIITVAAIICMVIAYYPHYINMPFKITNTRQVELAIRSVRVAAITLLLLSLAIVYTLLGMESPSVIPVLVVIVLLLLEIIVFSILAYKAKKRPM
jgi:hypothetical protein